jgi:DNA gyrase subunit B
MKIQRKEKKMSDQYTAESIESLDPLAFTRLRPGVYCGSTEYSTQLVIELFSNALDEFNLGHGDTIEVIVDKNKNIISVQDYGQGFLINEIREDGKTILEAAFSVLNTSGKYREDGVYEGTSLGLNGIGGKLPNYLSHWCEVESVRNGKGEKVYFEEGVFVRRELFESSDPNGTKITFNPSEEFFKNPLPDMKYLEKMFNDICCLCPSLTVLFNEKEIQHPNGIGDLLPGDDTICLTDKLIFQEKKDRYSLDCALRYVANNSSSMTAYVNYGLTDSGPHITAIKSCVTRVLNRWAKEKGLLKAKDKNLEGTALQEGLMIAFNLVSPGIAYDAQTKSRIVSNEFVPFVNESFSKQLELWLDNNPSYGENIIEKALLARKAAEAAKKAREAVRNKAEKKTKLKIAAMPSKLADCHAKDRSSCELYLTEGDSASGGAKIIRDASTQAIMGLRGKILNCLVADFSKIHKNAEVMDIIKALGLEWSADGSKVIYDETKLRYGKLVIAADRDSDGDHIQTLILTMLWTLVPNLILDGYVYIAQPPLYKAEWGTNYQYLDDKKAL